MSDCRENGCVPSRRNLRPAEELSAYEEGIVYYVETVSCIFL